MDRLVDEDFLRIDGKDYLPTFHAIEQQDADIRSIGRSDVNIVLASLKRLYQRHESDCFKLTEILADVKILDPAREEKDVVVGLILAADFDFFSSYSIASSAEGGHRIDNVSLKESVLDFSSAEEEWQRILARREAHRQRWAAQEAIQPDFIAEPAPKSEVQEFAFMRNPHLKRIAERDYRELSMISDRPVWKARLALTGSVIEALLLDSLQPREVEAKKHRRSSKKNQPLEQWPLASLIDVAVKLGIVKQDAHRFTQAVRDYRNLIHPAREIRGNLRVGESQSKIAAEVLNLIIQDLQESGA